MSSSLIIRTIIIRSLTGRAVYFDRYTVGVQVTSYEFRIHRMYTIADNLILIRGRVNLIYRSYHLYGGYNKLNGRSQLSSVPSDCVEFINIRVHSAQVTLKCRCDCVHV